MIEFKRELPECPVETCLMVMDGKWKPLIIRELLTGKKRFNELQKGLDRISQKVLTSNLKKMVADGLVNRTVYPEVPPRVEYELTTLGKSLSPVIKSMWDWGLNYQNLKSAGSG